MEFHNCIRRHWFREDDLALLSSKKKHIQEKVGRLNEYSKEIGMKTSIKKIKLMRYNAKDQTPLLIDGTDVEDVESFTYLGSIVNKTGGCIPQRNAPWIMNF